MNYETKCFGMDVLFSIKSQGEPYLQNPQHQETQINELFMQDMTQKKNEAEYFLSEYYSSEEKEHLFLKKEEEFASDSTIKTEHQSSSSRVKFEEEDSEPVKSEDF